MEVDVRPVQRRGAAHRTPWAPSLRRTITRRCRVPSAGQSAVCRGGPPGTTVAGQGAWLTRWLATDPVRRCRKPPQPPAGLRDGPASEHLGRVPRLQLRPHPLRRGLPVEGLLDAGPQELFLTPSRPLVRHDFGLRIDLVSDVVLLPFPAFQTRATVLSVSRWRVGRGTHLADGADGQVGAGLRGPDEGVPNSSCTMWTSAPSGPAAGACSPGQFQLASCPAHRTEGSRPLRPLRAPLRTPAVTTRPHGAEHRARTGRVTAIAARLRASGMAGECCYTESSAVICRAAWVSIVVSCGMSTSSARKRGMVNVRDPATAPSAKNGAASPKASGMRSPSA